MKEAAEERPFSADAQTSALLRELLSAELSAQGLYGYAFVSRSALAETLDFASVAPRVRQRYAVEEAQSAVVAALRYGEGEYPAPAWASAAVAERGDSPALSIARFARANWYKELSERLRAAVKNAQSAAARKGIAFPAAPKWHRLVNSGLPEKALAARAGLGRIGKNGILIAAAREGAIAASAANRPANVPAYSSAVVLGLLLCPVDLSPPEPRPVPDLCGECRRCVSACPTGALSPPESAAPKSAAPDNSGSGPGRRPERGRNAQACGETGFRYDRLRCIQHWTAIDKEVPADIAPALRGRLYGCDDCLAACPHFYPDAGAACGFGRLGSRLPAAYFLENDDTTIHRDLKYSALGQGWISIEALRRNARLPIP